MDDEYQRLIGSIENFLILLADVGVSLFKVLAEICIYLAGTGNIRTLIVTDLRGTTMQAVIKLYCLTFYS